VRERARERNARFVPIDLRWGISREAADQQETIEICLKGIVPLRAIISGSRESPQKEGFMPSSVDRPVVTIEELDADDAREVAEFTGVFWPRISAPMSLRAARTSPPG
jgi:hypothetical protein